jgi:hypothetical protein
MLFMQGEYLGRPRSFYTSIVSVPPKLLPNWSLFSSLLASVCIVFSTTQQTLDHGTPVHLLRNPMVLTPWTKIHVQMNNRSGCVGQFLQLDHIGCIVPGEGGSFSQVYPQYNICFEWPTTGWPCILLGSKFSKVYAMVQNSAARFHLTLCGWCGFCGWEKEWSWLEFGIEETKFGAKRF